MDDIIPMNVETNGPEIKGAEIKDAENRDKLAAGFYGKLPAHGDFIQRNLPLDFIEPWDEWLQQSICASKQALQDKWLDTYLTSPIWHFLLSPQLINEQAWLGILVPSVDSVGRYFPFTLAHPLPIGSLVLPAFYGHAEWFKAMENLMLSALEDRLTAEFVDEKLESLVLLPRPKSVEQSDSGDWLYNVPGDNYLPSAAALLGELLSGKHETFSIWRSSGSPKVPASTRVALNLPDKDQCISMMDGCWTDIPLL